ncbi:class I SAM-dependent methyltransferase [Sulfitobacter donghicola]|uniref:ATP synthase subunit beta n=1 Tax=Sulfitobacter donghicola DSW-25 = KCTC 12864 = JCM 14565 TaxID=1300350 RepID=A0A073ITW6_9RHOB|nr:SAM-dependent methyltransferase [Sulfitobacter donghicola]KEJ88847.1 ATP synthase subunit beta [Sulfitobacter donghicola DSW-25 = KCTC 12864 = JCM 14565]KIN68645.1 ATP synthase beta subunit/transription termination factor rho [Sulfitobacter donghicola DSW-25 = KCTC 12864 = JCM 14565]
MSLRDILIAQIAAQGPMRLDAYMSACLLHPEFGYYTTRPPFGAKGDFITAPEISQMFGELVGLALAQAWIDQGAPSPFTLAELGPGRGTLMADVLRATAGVPGFRDAVQVVLLEASPALRDAQAKSLTGYAPTWINTIQELPQQATFLVANEFFDALPIRQFIRDADNWRERQIGVQDGALVFGLGPSQQQPALSHRLEDTKDGDLIEDCAAVAPVLSEVCLRLEQFGGAALIFDYGDWRSLGDTLQAVQNHETTDPLANPGHADLTAHVDFEALLAAAAPCTASRVTGQGVFLERLGITARAQALAQSLSGTALENHIAAHRRLTHPEEMGTLFKTFGIVPNGKPMLPGLET